MFSVDITLDETVARVAGRNECEEGGEGKSGGLPTEINILLVLKRWASRAIDQSPDEFSKNLSENAQASLRTMRCIIAILIQASLVRGLIS